MAFPEYATSVTFNFTGTMNTDWVTTKGVGMWSNSGEGSANGVSPGEAAYTTTALTGALKEVVATHSTKGINGAWLQIALYKTANVTTAKDGYGIYFNQSDGRFGVAVFAAGVETDFAEVTLGWTPTQGDLYGISFDGTTVKGYVFHGGSWSMPTSYAPGTPYTGNMYGAIESPYSNAGSGQAWDDFKIGSGAIPSSGLSHLLSGKFYGLLGGKLS